MADLVSIFEAERKQLTSLCYRMLGDRAGAEDAVQDTWLRWMKVDHERVDHPAAWLRRAATNIAIDALRSARRQRETYVGPWLPEPLLLSETGPADDFELAQECELALLWAMERLGAEERAAFILREAFDAEYDEIATCLSKSPAACRQMVSRAHKRLQESGPRFDASPDQVEALISQFFAAATAEDMSTAIRLFAPDAVAISDGGRKARAARRILVGPEDIVHVMMAVWRKSVKETIAWSLEPCIANAAPAIVRRAGGIIDFVLTLAPNENNEIAWLYVMRNPDKLQEPHKQRG
ncbi:MAG: RNA polymerase sigma factor SigJ [Pseudomonadota bacterium]